MVFIAASAKGKFLWLARTAQGWRGQGAGWGRAECDRSIAQGWTGWPAGGGVISFVSFNNRDW